MSDKNIFLNKLQFYWRLKDNLNDKNIVPDFLPFESDYAEELRLLIQKRNKKVLNSLKIIYQEEPNIGHNQEISNWSSFYGKDFLSFIEDAAKKGRKIKRVLEVGCGGCLLLEQLKKKGLKVMGIDPSSFAQKEGRKRGIKVVRDFFPSKKIEGKFDLIFHSNVLEHVANPVGFLKSQLKHLEDGGMLVLAAPDCTECILNGDISMFYHQHLSYFDNESLYLTLRSAGFGDIQMRKANFGGNLYCFAKKNEARSKDEALIRSRGDYKYAIFLKRYKTTSSSIKNLVSFILANKNSTLGFYAPLRTLPYIAVMNLKENFRFFDDTSYWRFKYFDGINVQVENFEDLKRNPVTDLIIMSPTFGDVIEEKVIKHFGGRIRVNKLTDFYRFKLEICL